jgi:hypothetical protein
MTINRVGKGKASFNLSIWNQQQTVELNRVQIVPLL